MSVFAHLCVWVVFVSMCVCSVCDYVCVGEREGSILTSTQNDLEAVDAKQQADIPAQRAPNSVATDATSSPRGYGRGSVKHWRKRKPRGPGLWVSDKPSHPELTGSSRDCSRGLGGNSRNQGLVKVLASLPLYTSVQSNKLILFSYQLV